MKIGLLLLSPAQHPLIPAAAALRRALLETRPGGSAPDVVVLATDPLLAGRLLPGEPEAGSAEAGSPETESVETESVGTESVATGARIRAIGNAITDVPGRFDVATQPPAEDMLSLAGTEAMSCDAWIVLDDATELPLAVDRPMALWAPEFTDRIATGTLPSHAPVWSKGALTAFHNRLAARVVVVPDATGRAEAAAFALVPPGRIARAPLPALGTPGLSSRDTSTRPRTAPYLLWHPGAQGLDDMDRVLATIRHYGQICFGQCAVVLTDPGAPRSERLRRSALKALPGWDGDWMTTITAPTQVAQAGAQAGAEPTPAPADRAADDPDTIALWVRHADAVILGPGLRAGWPVLEAARHWDRPVLLTGPARSLRLQRALMPGAAILDPADPAPAAAFLRAAERRAASGETAPARSGPRGSADGESVGPAPAETEGWERVLARLSAPEDAAQDAAQNAPQDAAQDAAQDASRSDGVPQGGALETAGRPPGAAGPEDPHPRGVALSRAAPG